MCYCVTKQHYLSFTRMEATTDNDQELIVAAQRNREAYALLYDKYFDQIYRYIFFRVDKNEDTTADLTAEVFARGMQYLPTYQWQGHPYSAYLYQVARSILSEEYGRQSKFSISDISDIEIIDVKSGENILTQTDVQLLWQAIITYPEPIPEVFELRYLEDKSYDEIAEIIGKRPGTIRTLVSRTLKQLQKSYGI
ncbi:MAG: hypothetical protein COW24_04480 [Candidatus Kerfeldbacteria bacterium CG15_BIG_FIL_POST_REV_8_21_14_020_45_12]|uniref:RNA polymerase sigma-70 region 2 domain-containing protein n=1 Tax=Candidatus Kerfeldbacteria bacterium CG15_BIG_FIL_POST_REV_8_21_14_020_45_12 TaxID=2014247 RepID=A0A2M7H2X1_9BACT|nr:MAG: hypothetical protein COW24_04480 [Candidatus Kerfeldbacteria bacterium CG15_BIG_FIL_POST_REV_8_21_14_020_45_12]PJA93349.1 MAG: hypothetical protein CO132_03255 [Candidatus Kerfeldbacteria bacterium CG_4_9_14_3_um_filter_45_8]